MSYVTCEKTMSDAVSRANSDFLAAANEIAAHTLATTIRTPKRLTGGAKSVGNVAVALGVGAVGGLVGLAVNALFALFVIGARTVDFLFEVVESARVLVVGRIHLDCHFKLLFAVVEPVFFVKNDGLIVVPFRAAIGYFVKSALRAFNVLVAN